MSLRPGVRVALRALTAAGIAVAAAGCGTLSIEEEKQLGHEAQRQVRQHFQMMRDRVVVNYVREIGDRLVAASDPSPFDFRFYVVEDPEINAFALPAGAIYVHTGTILKAKDVSELAGVIAHEIGHVTARHVANLYRRQRNTGVVANVVTLIVAIVTGNPYVANAAQLGTAVAATAYTSQFTREAERESDRLAVEAMIRAGYDPDGLVTFFATLQKEAQTGGLAMPQVLSSHPATDERIQTVRAHIASKGAVPGLRRDDGGRLQIIKERIELIIGTDVESDS
jgi:predicted Zn-dependent protease